MKCHEDAYKWFLLKYFTVTIENMIQNFFNMYLDTQSTACGIFIHLCITLGSNDGIYRSY